MTSEKLEYDSSLGGPVVLESHVQTYRYAAASVQEIKRLFDEIRHPSSTKLAFQKLPKHMRRRAMSHHPKRLPRKYRGIHCSQMAKAGKPQQTKRPSRKYQRKPSNLLREYLRRQRRHIWLETHIWHAKRFHMATRWGYRLPYASCDKTYRACYRATTQHCLVQDVSFYACLQLNGTLTEIAEGFTKLTTTNCGLSIAAKTFISGRREGSLELFRAGQYPEGALGRISFIWKPLEASESELNAYRILWLWVHPSGYQAVLEEIIKVFALISMKSVKVPLNDEVGTESENLNEKKGEEKNKKSKIICSSINKDFNTRNQKKCSAKQQLRLQFMTKTFAHERIKRYTNEANTLTLSELKDTLNRFRLTGPLAQSVLAHAFKAKPINWTEEPDNWFRHQLEANTHHQEYHQAQADYWQQCAKLRSPTELMSNIIIALNIEDPRIHRPQKRTKAIPKYDPGNSAQLQKLKTESPITLPHSFIWQSDVRDYLCAQMVSTHSYCELREKHTVVPGTPCVFERQLQPVPVLLIQRPGSQCADYKRLGYGCGWDIIAPAGYGMSIWLALIMWGAKPGGLREFASIARESGIDEFLPDTVGGQQQLAERYIQLRDKYFRLPSNKRCNYQKIAIISPFHVPFKQLVRDWHSRTFVANTITASSTLNSFFILRDWKMLQQLQLCIKQRRSSFPKEISTKCLIQMQFVMKSRGNLDDFAVICLPTRNDFKRNLKLIKHENRDPIFTEPLQSDPNEKQRKTLRIEHKKLLKRLRSRRVREKRKQQQTSTQKVHIQPAGTSQLVTAQFKRMSELWLSETKINSLYSVRKQCSREVFGYITNSNFSYIEATVGGVGYVTIEGLRQLLEVCSVGHVKRPMCLVRSTNSRHYRFATFKLNIYN